jgi:hypothetical protein
MENLAIVQRQNNYLMPLFKEVIIGLEFENLS